MKKTVSFVFLCFFTLSAAFSAPYEVSGNSGKVEEIEFSGKNKVFVFDGLAGATITLTADVEIDTAVCKTFLATAPTGSLADFTVDTLTRQITVSNLSDATGYIFLINETEYAYIYVLDYNNYLPTIHSVDAEGDCVATDVTAKFSIPSLVFYLPASGTTAILERPALERNFILKYKTLQWNENAEKFDEKESKTEPIPRNYLLLGSYTWYSLDSIFINTKFTLTGENDPYVKKFGQKVEMESAEFVAQKPVIKALGELTLREAKNEREKGNDKERRNLSGSAPMDVNLRAHANTPLARDFTWYIYEKQQPEVPVSYSREQEFNLKFSVYGTYVARVTTTTENDCVATDSVTIEVTESEIDIPNVFTPNDDSFNDKFCVAFKSIVKYNIWIYNRWGRLVFSSNSPENCWDGYIGNQKAATGAYYYKIEATGADGKKYKRAGDINLLR